MVTKLFEKWSQKIFLLPASPPLTKKPEDSGYEIVADRVLARLLDYPEELLAV